MRKKVILISVLLIFIASCFICVNIQKTVTIKSPFVNLYSFLSQPDKWVKWLPGLRKNVAGDSAKISVQKDSRGFKVKFAPLEVAVQTNGTSFDVTEQNNGKNISYSYTLVPVQDKFMNKTLVTAKKEVNAINYLIGFIWGAPFNDTHINYLKKYLETDSLIYGCGIFKTKVPGSFLIVLRNRVLKKDKFMVAANMLDTLNKCVKIHNAKRIGPLVAQFLPEGKDSAFVKVGFFTDKEIKSEGTITFNHMPKGGPLYAAQFKGAFNKRQIVYTGLQQYFTDHLYQSAITPFETYLDNKLPTSDTGKVNIQVNFSALY